MQLPAANRSQQSGFADIRTPVVFYDRTVGFAQLVAVSGGIWKPLSGQDKHCPDKAAPTSNAPYKRPDSTA